MDGIILQKPQQAKTPGEQLSIISIFFFNYKNKIIVPGLDSGIVLPGIAHRLYDV